MTSTEVLDLLRAIIGAIINALAAGLHAAGRAALSNVTTAEWVVAAALAGSAWLLSIGRGWRAAGVLTFALTAGACAWLNWKVGRHGALAQQAVMAAMILHGISRGYASTKKGNTR